ncbi:MAG: hypothetical protein Q9160_006611 [Pyrenula sp. 1 TL-2023]
MKRQFTPADRLETWAKFNGVDLLNTQIQITEAKGTGLFARINGRLNGVTKLIVVPKDLVLSLRTVDEYAKADRHLREVLDAVGDFGRTARGAILIFLILQITHSSPEAGEAIGVSNPLTEYLKFLPEEVSLPTLWSDEEREILHGTSLAAAVEHKLQSLDNEFEMLREKTKHISWCNCVWWDEDTGHLTIDDWRTVDALYRSRALELPGTGHAMVPCVDMANHASGNDTIALYETDVDGNAILQLRDDKSLNGGQEVSITFDARLGCLGISRLTLFSYGDRKGACEMIYSYGFLEDSQQTARELFLDLDIPNDDPLKQAKKFVNDSAPGVKIYEEEGEVKWDSPFVYWACVNEDEGLNFSVAQDTDGNQNLEVFWKNQKLDPSSLADTLRKNQMWEIFQLRANMLLESRIKEQLQNLSAAIEVFSTGLQMPEIDSKTLKMIERLQILEATLLHRACQAITEEKTHYLESLTVQRYLNDLNSLLHGDEAASDEDSNEDFS